jgi:carboxylesterase
LLPGLAIAATLAGAIVGWRWRAAALVARDWRARHGLEGDATIAGAEPIALDAGPRAVLLLHGFGDTPQSLAPQARALHAHGWTVRVPLLPGHGRSLEAFSASTAEMWTAHARATLAELRATHAAVALVGQSMGGALAAILAAESSPPSSAPIGAAPAAPAAPAALVLLAPFLELSPSARRWTTLWPLWSLWRRWVPGDADASIRDPRARAASLGYGVASPRLLREVRDVVDAAAAALGAVRLPTLVVHSVDDYRITRGAAERSFARLRTSPRELRWVARSGHVITVDHDSAEVTAMLLAWLERHVPPSRAEAQSVG